MRLRLELTLGVGLLLALQLITSLAAIGLLTRMSPAVQEILLEEVATEEAVMLGVLASPEGNEPAGRTRFAEALEHARSAATDPEEVALLDLVYDRGAEALAGDPAARRAVAGALEELTARDRRGMEEAAEAARRLGTAGAWAAVLLGIVSFLVGEVAYRRLRTRLEAPIVEIDRALHAVRMGDLRRRVAPIEGPSETQRIVEDLNWLLDKERRVRRAGHGEELTRAAMLHLLDARPEPTLLVHTLHGVLATNRSAIELWSEAEPRHRALQQALKTGRPPPVGWVTSKVANTDVWVCSLTGEAGGQPPAPSS